MWVDIGTSERFRPFGAISSCDEIETRAPALATPPAVSNKATNAHIYIQLNDF